MKNIFVANPVYICVSCLPCLLNRHFGFCMLTSVDKMFIRFIFAKDMQLHYIWYFKNINKNLFLFSLSFFLFLSQQLGCSTSLLNKNLPIFSPLNKNSITLH